MKLQHHNRKNSLTEDKVAEKSEEMPLYPQSILKKPQEFPPVPFSLDLTEKVIEDDNESLDIVLPNRDLNYLAGFDRPSVRNCYYKFFFANILKISREIEKI